MEYELILACIVLTSLTFLAIVESAHGCLSDVALRSLAADQHASISVRFLRHILEHRQLFWLSLSIGIQLTIILLAALLLDIAIQLTNPILALLVAPVGVFFLVTLFRQIFPRLLVQNSPGFFFMHLLPVYKVYFEFALIFIAPIYRLIRIFRESQEMSFTPESMQSTITEDTTLQALIDVGEEEGIIEEADSELIHSIVEFGDTIVKEIMTQRKEMVCIEATATIGQTCDIMVKQRHSRLPVYRNTTDNIEGVVYIRDLLPYLIQKKTDEPISKIARSAYFIPENKLLSELLGEMRKSSTQIAMVINEFGGVAGLVTIEDILEEIVGEIEDEDAIENAVDKIEIVEETDGYYVIKGSTEIRKIELLVETELESDDFITINGFITNNLGRVPNIGEQLILNGLQIEILEADGRAIRKLRLHREQLTT